MNSFDTFLFLHLNSLSGHFRLLDYTGIFLADYLQFVLGAFLLVLMVYPKSDVIKNRSMVVVSIIAALTARYVVKTGILFFYGRGRPFVVLPIHSLIITIHSENFQSFPSGHAIFFFAVAAALYLFNKKIGAWYFIAACAMGVARVYVGVHWPSDILGGAVLGVLVGYVVYTLYSIRKAKLDILITAAFKKINL